MIQRKQEILEIVKCISDGKNALIAGALYQGKTVMLEQLEAELNKEKVSYIYIDCRKCFDGLSFLTEYSKQVLKMLSGGVSGAVQDAYSVLPNIKPSMSSSASKGVELSMSYSFTLDDMNKFALDVLDAPYKVSKLKGEQIVVILDDYDSLLKIDFLELHKFMARKSSSGVVYVCSTTDFGLVKKLKIKRERQKLSLGLITDIAKFDQKDILKEIVKKFHSVEIEEGAMQYVTDNLGSNIFAIEELIINYPKNSEVTARGVKRAITAIIEKKDKVFQLYFDSLSVHQKKLIIAIAKHSGEHVFKGEFIYNNGLVSVPSVQTSIKGLIKKQFVSKDSGIRFVDQYFKEWLRRTF